MDYYNTDSSKWEAYQFSDPFATNSFFCLNNRSHIICRPNCDVYPKDEVKEHVTFLDNLNSIDTEEVSFCQHCDPSSDKTALNLELIKKTIDSINSSIGFTKDSNDLKRRAYSVPSVKVTSSEFGSERLSRNESEHFKLVELACRHIAAAAVENLTKKSNNDEESKKKRRGGVLGFKELAIKSKLSAWHFHRVFKSVTGLTPKSYGDRCWDFIKSRDRPQTYRQQKRASGGDHSHFKSTSNDIFTKSGSASSRKRSVTFENDPISPSDIPTGKKRRGSNVKSPKDTSKKIDLLPFDTYPYGNDLFMGSHQFDLNKNSLDINDTPVRHHTVDLSALNYDLSDLNSKPLQNAGTLPNSIDQKLSISPSNNLAPVLSFTTPQSFPLIKEATIPFNQTPLENSIAIPQIDETQWPTLQASTPPDQVMEDDNSELTPPTTLSEQDYTFKPLKSKESDLSFLDVLHKSPLEDQTFISLNDYISDDDHFLDITPQSELIPTYAFGASSGDEYSKYPNPESDQTLFIGNTADDFLAEISDDLNFSNFGNITMHT